MLRWQGDRRQGEVHCPASLLHLLPSALVLNLAFIFWQAGIITYKPIRFPRFTDIVPLRHLLITFELIYVEITHKHTSVIAKQTECGMLPWHTFDTNPCWKARSIRPASSSCLSPYKLNVGFTMSPPPGYRGTIKALGSWALQLCLRYYQVVSNTVDIWQAYFGY